MALAHTRSRGAASPRRVFGRWFLTAALAALLTSSLARGDGFLLTSPSSPAWYAYAGLAGNRIQVAGQARVAGDLHANDRVHLLKGSLIAGGVSASGTILNQGTVQGSLSPRAPRVELPLLLSDADLQALADRVHEGDLVAGDARIDDVLFVRGNVRFQGDLAGSGTVIATGEIRLDAVTGEPVPPAPASRLSLIARGDVRLDKGRSLRGAVYAGRDLALQKDVQLEGVAVAGRDLTLDSGARLTFASPDQTPPVAVLVAPPEGSVVDEPRPRIEVAWSDDLSGVDVSSLRFRLDGQDRTAQAAVSPGGLTFTPAEPLADGLHTVEVALSDHAGNAAASTFRFQRGFVTILRPTGVVEGDASPLVAVAFAGAEFDALSIRVTLDGVPLAGCRYGLTQVLCEPPALAAGTHTVHAEVRDGAGALRTADGTFELRPGEPGPDPAAPALAILSPAATTYADPTVREPVPDVVVEYSDAGSGIDLGSLEILLDGGLDLTPVCDFGTDRARCALPILFEGSHSIRAGVRDLAGNPASAELAFAVQLNDGDDAAPVLEVLSPAAGAVVNTGTIEVTGIATDDAGLAGVLVNSSPAAVEEDGRFTVPTVLMAEGENRILVAAFDSAGRVTRASFGVILDRTAPEVAVTAPAPGFLTNAGEVLVEGTASDDRSLAAVEVGGVAAGVAADGTWSARVPVAPGPHTLTVIARDAAGNRAEAALPVRRFAPPALAFDQPAPEARRVRADRVQVSGTVEPPDAEVTVGGIPATVADGRFQATVDLREGVNHVVAASPGADGSLATATIQIVRDVLPPRLTVDRPADGAEVFEPVLTVSGSILDLTAGAPRADGIEVTVADRPATISGGRFVATGVPLTPGENVFMVGASDPLGNTASRTVTVTYVPTEGQPRIERVMGDGQTGPAGSVLPIPLEVSVVDAGGAPVAGVPVVFRVVAGDGSLAAGTASGRAVVATSDAQGRASAAWTLGRSAAAGRNRVEATAAGFLGRPGFDARAQAGAPARVLVDMGNNQTGAVGQPLPRPLIVVVTDEANNRLAGVPVRFEVTAGGGGIGGEAATTVATDADGRAFAWWTLGPEPGIDDQSVRASVDGAGAALFVATGLVAGDPAETRVTGVVLDNSDRPVPGVTVSIVGTALSARTDAAGRFALAPVPPGHQHLDVDGSTAELPGVWAHLAFDLFVVPGAEQDMGRPIYLVDLAPESSITVSETEGGTITLPEVPGFELTVEPGAATFPGGVKTGRLSVSVVHSDKVPMTPTSGQQPQLVITFQPPGARLDPPARLVVPNVDGLAPGEATEIYSFDHDQGQFLVVSTATVSEDALTVRSDPGLGLLETGWHAAGTPPPPGDACGGCGECGKCYLGECFPLPPTVSCDDGLFCTQNKRCFQFTCESDPIPDRPGASVDIDVAQIVELVDEVAAVANVASQIGPCDFGPPQITGGFSGQKFERCCEEERKFVESGNIAGGVTVDLGSVECFIPGLSVSVPGVNFGVYLGAAAQANVSVSTNEDPCLEESCGPLFQVTGGITGEGGGRAEVEALGFDVIDGRIGLQFQGTFSFGYDLQCGSTGFDGMVGPIQWFAEVQLTSFIVLRYNGILPYTWP